MQTRKYFSLLQDFAFAFFFRRVTIWLVKQSYTLVYDAYMYACVLCFYGNISLFAFRFLQRQKMNLLWFFLALKVCVLLFQNVLQVKMKFNLIGRIEIFIL